MPQRIQAMRQLNKVENAIFVIGALLMLAGAIAGLFRWQWFPYVYAVGAVCFASMQMLQRYEGSNFTIRRLRRIMLLSDVLFLVSALLMLASQGNFLGLNYLSYIKYVHNNWIVALLVAAILQLYTSHRIANEIEKEAKKR